MSENSNQVEILSNVLNVTRDQLTRSMNVNAELEALLNIERTKTEQLTAEIAKLKSEASSKDTSSDKK
jgi:hypothetical protein